MNTDFAGIGPHVERYFQTTLFYGIYPSFFSPNAADSPYWENADYYDRDRDLFQKYVPLIREINTAGWQPVTYARSSTVTVYVERFGNYPDLYFTLRNVADSDATTTLTFDIELGLPNTSVPATSLVTSSLNTTIASGEVRTLTVTIDAHSTEVVRVGE